LQGSTKLVFVSHLSFFEFFFHCRKQIEATGGSIRSIAWLWYAAHVMFFEPISWSPTCVTWAIVEINHKSFWCDALAREKIAYLSARSLFVTK
jgi:hypothetical protein